VTEINQEFLFRVLFASTYAAFAIVRVRFRLRDAKERGDRQPLGPWGVLISALIICLFASIGLYLISPDWYAATQLDLPAWLRWLGLGAALASTVLVAMIHRTLGRMYSASLTIREGHRIVTSGPYRRIRHPMYTILYVFGVSMALLSANGPMLMLSALIILPLRMIAIREESMLTTRFGDRYRAYMERTGRFLPKL